MKKKDDVATGLLRGRQKMKSLASALVNHWSDSMFWQDIFVRNLLIPLLYFRNAGFKVLEAQWDNLVILDACRYDTFEKHLARLNSKGRLESRVSSASDTRTFLQSNFPGPHYDEIVYVSANPVVSRFMEGKFHAMIPVWRSGWDKSESTVLPETVADRALSAARSHPGKRMIIHFMQPHHPYLGFKPDFAGSRRLSGRPPTVYSPWPADHSWYTYFVTHDSRDLMKLYENNLARVMNSVKELVARLGGTTVVTSDHGEAFGERLHPLVPIRVYEHPPHVRIPVLVKIPWYVIEGGHPEPGHSREQEEEDALGKGEDGLIMERLKALGYE